MNEMSLHLNQPWRGSWRRSRAPAEAAGSRAEPFAGWRVLWWCSVATAGQQS